MWLLVRLFDIRRGDVAAEDPSSTIVSFFYQLLLDIFFSLLHYRLISIFRIAVATGCRATPLLTTIIPNQRGIPDRNRRNVY